MRLGKTAERVLGVCEFPGVNSLTSVGKFRPKDVFVFFNPKAAY